MIENDPLTPVESPLKDSKRKREKFIPISRSKLFDALPEIQSVSRDDQDELRELFRILDAFIHHQYYSHFAEIERLYQPLDPDSVFKIEIEREVRFENSKHVFERLEQLLDRANYRKLEDEDLETAIETASVLGIQLRVDFSMFEELHVYGRGDRTEKWKKRTWWKLFREEEFDVDVYQRLVIAFRLREDKKISKDHSPDVIYIKSFKSIPHSDMHALLPGTQVKMSLVDQGRIILPTLSGLAVSLFKLVRLMMVISIFATIFSFFYITGLVIGVLAYLVKGVFSYWHTRDKYYLNLTRHLYFQNLDNNSGVLLRVLSEAEKQDFREVVISYYILWKFGEDGLTVERIDEIAEQSLQEATEIDVDFEVEDAVSKLQSLGMADEEHGLWKCKPIRECMTHLDYRWDSVFSHNWPNREFGKTQS